MGDVCTIYAGKKRKLQNKRYLKKKSIIDLNTEMSETAVKCLSENLNLYVICYMFTPEHSLYVGSRIKIVGAAYTELFLEDILS